MRAKAWVVLVIALIAASMLSPAVGGGVAVAQSDDNVLPQPQPTRVVPSDILPPGVQLPPGFELPPGIELPPGLLPENLPAVLDSPAMQILGDEQDRPDHPQIAGLGSSNARPSGTPMELSLRPGWRLTDIRGGAPDEYFERCMLGDPSRRLPECALARGMFEVTLHFERSLDNQAADMRISQADDDLPLAPLVPDPDYPLAPLVPEPDDPLAPLVPVDAPPLNNSCTGQARWSGWVLDSGSDGQNIWVPVWTCLSTDGKYTVLQDTPRSASPQVTAVAMHLASADVYELTLSGFCLNGDRHVPGEEHSYNIGVLSDDPGLNRLLQAIKGKRIESMQDRMQLQSYVWVYTEGQELTDADWSGLAALP